MSNLKLVVLCMLLLASSQSRADINGDILSIQHQWAKANYETPEAQQEKVFEELVAAAYSLMERNPYSAESKVWLAIVLSTDAGVNGGLGALGKVKEARVHLLAAEKLDPDVLNGSIYTSLGSLYYQVPGWPIGFGDEDKAREYLEKALAMNPDGIDPNYFFGDFMLEEGEYGQAIKYFEKALQAPARPNRPLADMGRRDEVSKKLQLARSRL